MIIQYKTDGGDDAEIVVSNKASSPLYEQIATQIKAAIMSGELKAGEAIPSVRALAKSLHISILTVQKAYATLQEDGFIETTAGKGCYVSAQNQDFYLEEQQKKIEEKFSEAVGIARTSGINLDKLYHDGQAGDRSLILDIGKIPGFDVYLFRQVFSCEMLCFPRFLYVCAESFKTGAIFNFCHIASPTYILYFIVCTWNVAICGWLKLYNSYIQ